MAGKKLRIEVVSDPVCPWCYVGKRRLESALARRPGLEVDLQWRPFQLNPDMPRAGRNRREYYREKFGAETAENLLAGMQQTGEEVGIQFGSDPDAVAPNTLSAHVLMQWADADPGVDADELAEKLFAAHHVACEDIGDHAVLARIAGEVGMDESEVATRLAAGVDEEAVEAKIAHAVSLGVSGVPFFIVNGKYGISGAQPPEVLVDAFDQIAAED
ncbi:MAG: DsbA family oxidoreductase [Gammaproteobacteria bacterium]|nr:DsbA family oxidoreductase [Gammaproteobacteria bacterium]NND37043.1 DsbA family oxidoreductase [Gammaproteobacteria bacterium]